MDSENVFATFPTSNQYTLPIGTNHFDFRIGVVLDADGNKVSMAKKTSIDTPLKYLWIDCDSDINIEVRYLGEIRYTGRVVARGFYFEDLIYDEIIVTTTVATDIHLVGSSSVIAGVGGSGGGATSGIDIIEPAVCTTALCAAGAAIEFDVAFSDLATLNQVMIEQLTAGTYDYTFEIWNSATYNTASMAERYKKKWSRDVDEQEWGENIEGGLIYTDADLDSLLHCRIVNNAGGTTSTFNVSVIGVEG